MDCDGEGAMSTIVTGLEWIHDNMVQPAVVLMSIGGTGTLLLDQACQSLVNAGATVVVAAGNEAEGMQMHDHELYCCQTLQVCKGCMSVALTTWTKGCTRYTRPGGLWSRLVPLLWLLLAMSRRYV